MRRVPVIFLLLLLTFCGFSQRVLINSTTAIYDINKGGSLCASADAGAFCNPNNNSDFLFSIALHKDTLYFISRYSGLYRMQMGNTASCTLLTTFPLSNSFSTTINSLAVDKDGIVYAADAQTRELHRYDPHTNTRTVLGFLNVIPAGDLMFYKKKLLLAATNGSIYEVNLTNPSASTVYVQSSGIQFFGLIGVPFDCTHNKYYGLQWWGGSTRLYEIDLENRQILNVECEVPFLGYDAASNVDDGNTLGVTIDSLVIQPPCFDNNKANLQVKAYSAGSGALTYTLDDVNINTTGNFPQLAEGLHKLSVKNEQNCVADTVFSIQHGLSSTITIDKSNPFSCVLQDGTISVSASSGYLPLSYRMDNGNFTSDPLFKNQAGGLHTLRIQDAMGCIKDTSVILTYQTVPDFLSSVKVQPTYCTTKTGSISVSLATGIDPSDITTAINNGTPQQGLSFNGLDAGNYVLSIISKNNCRYDTTVHINQLINPSPTVSINVTNQLCFTNNGEVNLSINGNYDPYKTNFNSQGASGNSVFKNLAPGKYPLAVIDKDGCALDTTAEVLPYAFTPVTSDITITQPTCKEPTSGTAFISVAGTQDPYTFMVGNKTYTNNTVLQNLPESQFSVLVYNKDMCVVDTNLVVLKTELSPECERIFIPNAFTPNGDGNNELFRAIPGYSIDYFDLKVFNRWGQLVFTTTNKHSGWDGRLNGKPVPSGTFTWVLVYNTTINSAKKTKTGTVTLIR